MSYSLVPSWSKEPKLKFATHNARIETITDKPTWKTPFQRQHCIVPLTSFFEFVYEGPLAGHMIEFKESSHSLLFAAGLFDHWTAPTPHQNNTTQNQNSFFSFTIITTTPSKFILDHGHDRSPLFFKFCSRHSMAQFKK